jgi:hypothetical protein
MAPLKACTMGVEYKILSPSEEVPSLTNKDTALLATDMSS